MSTTYSKSSPYRTTEVYGNYLDVMTPRQFPKLPDDVVFQITPTYQFRPDLLAFDLYGDAGLWWVFAVRNPNVITDPLGDFVAGASIRIPKKVDLDAALGM